MVFASISKRILLLASLLCLALANAAASDSLSAATLVLFNSNDPESAELARYYAGRRNIPPAQVVGLACPASEEITRADFERTIAAPLREKMESNGWWKTVRVTNNKKAVVETSIRFVAIMRGMPLKIAADRSIPPPADTRNIPPAISSRTVSTSMSMKYLRGAWPPEHGYCAEIRAPMRAAFARHSCQRAEGGCRQGQGLGEGARARARLTCPPARRRRHSSRTEPCGMSPP